MFKIFLFALFSLCLTKIEVFLVPHTHIDEGWLKTVTGYESEVHHILDSVVSSLRKDADRRFTWGEVYYFKTWYEGLERANKKKEISYIHHLIKSKRFFFVCYGIVQNDEALPSYYSIIEQITFGLNWLKEKFDIEPKIAWQIDPFGHDLRMVSLLSQMGFDAYFINRVHFNIKAGMKKNKALEFIWNIGDKNIFTHTLWKHYSSPEGLDFEKNAPVTESNKEYKTNQFIRHVDTLVNDHRTNHLFIPVGDDFKFKNSERQYTSWERIIGQIKSNPSLAKKYDVKFGSIGEYVDSIFKYSKENNIEYPVVKHDFFPYQDGQEAWWTGFYSTWPRLKRDTRRAEESYFAASQLLSVAGNIHQTRQDNKENEEDNVSNLFHESFEKLQDSLIQISVGQHHDAITGTSRRATINDYFKRLASSISKNVDVEKHMVDYIMQKEVDKSLTEDVDGLIHNDPETDEPRFAIKEPKKYGLLIHNPSRSRTNVIKFLSFSKNLKITLEDDKAIDFQISPVLIKDFQENSLIDSKDVKLYNVFVRIFSPGFSVQKIIIDAKMDVEKVEREVEGSGTNILFIKDPSQASRYKAGISNTFKNTFELADGEKEGEMEINNEKYKIIVSKSTGYIKSVRDKENHIVHNWNEEMFKHFQTTSSGAYIFKPTREAVKFDNQVKFMYLQKGPIVDQLLVCTTRLNYWVTLYHAEPGTNSEERKEIEYFAKFNYHLFPLHENTEMVVQLMTSPSKKSQLMTYNGLFFTKRDKDRKFGQYPIAGRFYPSPYGGVMKTTEGTVSVLQNSVFAVSVLDNKYQIMLHRRLQRDDGRGMSEGNRDDTHFRSSFFFAFDSPSMDSNNEEPFVDMQRKSVLQNRPIFSFFTSIPELYADFYSFINDDILFSKNFEIVSLEYPTAFDHTKFGKHEVLLRIRNLHYSEKSYLDLHSLLPNDVIDIQEKSLNDFYEIEKNHMIEDYRDQEITRRIEKEYFFDPTSSSPRFPASIVGNDAIGYPMFQENDETNIREEREAEEFTNLVFNPNEIRTFRINTKLGKEYHKVSKDLEKILEEKKQERIENLKKIEKEKVMKEIKKERDEVSQKWMNEFEKNQNDLKHTNSMRKHFNIYFLMILCTFAVLFFLFTSAKKKKKGSKLTNIPFEGVTVKYN